MALRYEVTVEPGFIRVAVSRPVTAENIRQFCLEVPELARKSGVSKVLLDQRRIPSALNSMERFKYATEFAEYFRGLQVACVQENPLRDPQHFGETVAVNRGVNLRVFSTLEEAYGWLEVKPADKPASSDDSQ